MRKVTTENFIKRSNLIHDNKYDYSLSEYKTAKTKTIIICLKHGEFLQTPDAHLAGKGCQKCGHVSKRKLNLKTVISQFREVHGDKYDYSKVEYKNTDLKITIICPIHGEFKQTPNKHKTGCACPECGRNSPTRRRTNTEFIEEAKNIHGNKYLYDKVIYKTCKDSVIIGCKIHGYFLQTPEIHLLGKGCKKCGNKRTSKINSLTTEEFINRSINIHGDLYNYDKSIYVSAKTDIIITCKIHGDFTQSPEGHMLGRICPECYAKYNGVYCLTLAEKYKNIWKFEFALVYIIKCWNRYEKFYKIGITSKDLNSRFGAKESITMRMPYKYEVIKEFHTNKYNAVYLENKLHKLNVQNKYLPLVKFDGYTECFKLISKECV